VKKTALQESLDTKIQLDNQPEVEAVLARAYNFTFDKRKTTQINKFEKFRGRKS
jgi:hypothetical protein